MTPTELVQAVVALPAIRRLALPTDKGGLGITVEELENRLKAQVPSVVLEVGGAHEWDFAMKETSTTTTADTSTYTLKGDDNNAYQIASVRYGTAKMLLTKKTKSVMDDLETRYTISDVAFWVPAGKEDRFPKVRIVATPSETGTLITYDFWRNDIQLNDFTSDFDWFLTISLARRLLPDISLGLYTAALVDTIKRYDKGGADTDIAKMAPHIVNQNNARSKMYGYGNR